MTPSSTIFRAHLCPYSLWPCPSIYTLLLNCAPSRLGRGVGSYLSLYKSESQFYPWVIHKSTWICNISVLYFSSYCENIFCPDIFCPKIFCPKNILSEYIISEYNMSKYIMSGIYYVRNIFCPNILCPEYILSEYIISDIFSPNIFCPKIFWHPTLYDVANSAFCATIAKFCQEKS